MGAFKYAVIVAGGKGTRMQSQLPKQFLEIAGKPVIVHTIEKFLKADADFRLILVLPKNALDYWDTIKSKHLPNIRIDIVVGGTTRFDSVSNGLKKVSTDASIVAIHDAVRPCVSVEGIRSCVEKAMKNGSALPVVAMKDTIRLVENNNSQSVDRQKFRLVQTPQTFDAHQIKTAYKNVKGSSFTDDASVYEAAGFTVNLVEGNYENIKITTPEDLLIADLFLNKKQ